MVDKLNSKTESLLIGSSRLVSYLLHPFLVPVYMVLLLFGTGLVPIYASAAMKRYLLSVVFINTVFLPVMGIIILHVLRVIPDYSLSTKRDRVLPLFLVALCYGLAGWMLKDVQVVFILRRFIFAATGCAVFAFITNFFWKISLHMIAIGGAVGSIALLLYGGYYSLVWLLCGAIIAAGLLGTARLYLGKHTPAQVSLGFFGGFFMVMMPKVADFRHL